MTSTTMVSSSDYSPNGITLARSVMLLLLVASWQGGQARPVEARSDGTLLRGGTSASNRDLFDLPSPFDFNSNACLAKCSGTEDDQLTPFLNHCPKCPDRYSKDHCNHCCLDGASSLKLRWHGCPSGTFTFASASDGSRDCDLDTDDYDAFATARFVDCECYDAIASTESFSPVGCDTFSVWDVTPSNATFVDICIVSVSVTGEIDFSQALPPVIGVLHSSSDTDDDTHPFTTNDTDWNPYPMTTYFDTTCDFIDGADFVLPIFPGFGKFPNSCANESFIDLEQHGNPRLPSEVDHYDGEPPEESFWFEFIDGTSTSFWPTNGTGLEHHYFDPTFATCSCTECQPGNPTGLPSLQPSPNPTRSPSIGPTDEPSASPSSETPSPSHGPTAEPTLLTSPPSGSTTEPSGKPTTPTPSQGPTKEPTDTPTFSPTYWPTESPTELPTYSPTNEPSAETPQPTRSPTVKPTAEPTLSPPVDTPSPTDDPTLFPTVFPTDVPTTTPTHRATVVPTELPPLETKDPSSSPSFPPTLSPTGIPTDEPSAMPSVETSYPTQRPTLAPSVSPSWLTQAPSGSPTKPVTRVPSNKPTISPSRWTTEPTSISTSPTSHPTEHLHQPSHPPIFPSEHPTPTPSHTPSYEPSTWPFGSNPQPPAGPGTPSPSQTPSVSPSTRPSDCGPHEGHDVPTGIPSSAPTELSEPTGSNQPGPPGDSCEEYHFAECNAFALLNCRTKADDDFCFYPGTRKLQSLQSFVSQLQSKDSASLSPLVETLQGDEGISKEGILIEIQRHQTLRRLLLSESG